MTIKQLVAASGVSLLMWACIIMAIMVSCYVDGAYAEARIEFGPVVLESTVITESEETLEIEEFACEFDPPLKHITLIMHYYTDYVTLNEEYLELNPDEEDEVWGWSDCIWQPKDDWAACDVYLKIPDTVVDVDDYAIETAGHENWHASCGYFHK